MTIDPDVSRMPAPKLGIPGNELAKSLRTEALEGRLGIRASLLARRLHHRIAHMREANGQLLIAAVRAQKRAEEAETASHLKDEFLATVSHEMRTPLNAILGWARLLQSTQLPPDGAQRAIAAIGRNAAVVAHMIDDLLDTSRILNGAIRLVLGPVDLASVAREALDAVRPLAATRNVRLAFHAASGPYTVSGDAERLQQVIWNLLANAIKFTPDDGRVDIFIEPVADYMEVRVVDTGQGISPDLLPHVFERLRQADNATTRRQSGLGLGLGIARYFAELHGGTIQAASPGVGLGATFTVRLPIAIGACELQTAVRADQRAEPSTALSGGGQRST